MGSGKLLKLHQVTPEVCKMCVNNFNIVLLSTYKQTI
jgi:hypothetical protein